MSCFRFSLLLLLPTLVAPLQASDPEPQQTAQEQAAAADVSDQQRLYERFEETMSGVRLVGKFTVLGREEGPLAKEEYTINSVKKMPQGDYWLINARIKYGSHDVTLPLPLEVKWAGDTPVITLSELNIPLLGTFSSRVVIYNKKYAGTWTHGKVGGHLFGAIEKIEKDEADSDQR